MEKAQLQQILEQHMLFLAGKGGQRADLQCVDLRGADLRGADLRYANLQVAYLQCADLRNAYLQGANLQGAYLQRADLLGANLQDANLQGANLQRANLWVAYLRDADLRVANLLGAKGLIKIMGVEIGNTYWKRFDRGLCNNGYQFKIGLNRLRDGEFFASDERETCSYPGFHFASRSWCAVNYPERLLEARIRIPEGAKINEPWATDGKASADMIEILQVFDVATGEDVTEQCRPQNSKKGKP